MSASKWAYNPKRCDGDFCPGCCDVCGKRWDVDEEDKEGEIMNTIDKVLKGLECCNAPNNHSDCPYDGAAHYNICTHQLLGDAIALIKAQHEQLKAQQKQLKAHEWRKFEFREPDAEEKASHPDWVWVLIDAPYDGEEILVSDGEYGWKDEFCNDGDECYLDSGHEMEGCWWMPLPELPKFEIRRQPKEDDDETD